jgi:hypothetical protein
MLQIAIYRRILITWEPHKLYWQWHSDRSAASLSSHIVMRVWRLRSSVYPVPCDVWMWKLLLSPGRQRPIEMEHKCSNETTVARGLIETRSSHTIRSIQTSVIVDAALVPVLPFSGLVLCLSPRVYASLSICIYYISCIYLYNFFFCFVISCLSGSSFSYVWDSSFSAS